MDADVANVMSEYHARAAEELTLMNSLPVVEILRRRDEFLLPLGPESGQFLDMLARASGAKVILELGTSYGYSTVWLADAARTTGGHVVSLEMDANKVEFARRMVAKAGLSTRVDFIVGDARDSIRKVAHDIDLVLIDLWGDLYIPCFDLVLPKLAGGAFLVADNMLFPREFRAGADLYCQHVRTKPDVESVLLPIGSGLYVSRYCPPDTGVCTIGKSRS